MDRDSRGSKKHGYRVNYRGNRYRLASERSRKVPGGARHWCDIASRVDVGPLVAFLESGGLRGLGRGIISTWAKPRGRDRMAGALAECPVRVDRIRAFPAKGSCSWARWRWSQPVFFSRAGCGSTPIPLRWMYWKAGVILLIFAEAAYCLTVLCVLLGVLVLGPSLLLRRRDRAARRRLARGFLLCGSLGFAMVLAEAASCVLAFHLEWVNGRSRRRAAQGQTREQAGEHASGLQRVDRPDRL